MGEHEGVGAVGARQAALGHVVLGFDLDATAGVVGVADAAELCGECVVGWVEVDFPKLECSAQAPIPLGAGVGEAVGVVAVGRPACLHVCHGRPVGIEQVDDTSANSDAVDLGVGQPVGALGGDDVPGGLVGGGVGEGAGDAVALPLAKAEDGFVGAEAGNVDAEGGGATLGEVGILCGSDPGRVDEGVVSNLGEVAEDLGGVDGARLAPVGCGVLHPFGGGQKVGETVGDWLSGEVGGFEGGDADDVPAGAGAADAPELGVGVVGVADGEDAAVGVGGDGFDAGVEVGGDAAGFVEDGEHVTAVDSLEAVFVVVGGFATEADDVLVDEPFVVQLDTSGEVAAFVLLADFLPEDGVDLLVGGGGGDDDGLAGRVGVYPPAGEHPGGPGFPDAVAGLDGGPAVDGDGGADFLLLAPQVGVEAVAGPGRRIVSPGFFSRIGERIQLSEQLPDGARCAHAHAASSGYGKTPAGDGGFRARS